MRILYGVVGEGMGHATRSRVVLEHLLGRRHEIRVVVSGRAYKFLSDKFAGRANMRIDEIHGLSLAYQGNAVDKSKSLKRNLLKAPQGLLRNFSEYQKLVDDAFRPDVVISDFESWAYVFGIVHNIPVISIDNMQIINRCEHAATLKDGAFRSYLLAKSAVKIKLPRAYHYLITSFFFPRVRKPRTTLVPPILRPEILSAKREPGSHVLVYQTSGSNEALVPLLRTLPYEFRLYGMGREAQEDNVKLCAFSERGFVDDLRTARAVIAGGGFSLMGEAVHLRVPMLAVPLEKQFEQGLNARYLADLGYGDWAPTLDAAKITAFLGSTERYQAALQSYQPYDNAMLFGCVDELLERVVGGGKAPERLLAANMGAYKKKPRGVSTGLGN